MSATVAAVPPAETTPLPCAPATQSRRYRSHKAPAGYRSGAWPRWTYVEEADGRYRRVAERRCVRCDAWYEVHE